MTIEPTQRALCIVFASALSAALTGCNLSQFSAPSDAGTQLHAISGMIHGGQQPIAGATIQLYAANTTTRQGASSALLTQAVTTAGDGRFTIAESVTCPSSGALVYLVATGGNPGLPGNVNNTSLALMSLLGTCASVNSLSFLSVNELTTVASVEALAPYMADALHVGSDAANPSGLTGAFATAVSLVNFVTGTPQPAASGSTLPTALLDTLADILAACVNTSGSTAGGTNCGKLLANAGTGGATDTLTAALKIAQSPSLNVDALYTLVGTAGPFLPALPSAPASLVVSLSFPVPVSTVGASGFLLAIDTAQHIWVYTRIEIINPAGGPSTSAGIITIYDNNGTVLKTITAGTGGLQFVGQLAPDPFGNMWAVNSNLTLSKFDTNGNPLSPPGGFPVPYIPPPQLGGSTQGYPLGISYMQSDPAGNLWGIGSGTSSNCFIEVNNAGTVITPAGNFCTSAGNAVTIAAATDGSGNAWFVGTNSVAKVNSSGAIVATGVNSNGCFDFNLSNTNTLSNSTLSLAYDRVHDHLWGASDLGIGELRGDGSQVFCTPNATGFGLAPLVTTATGGPAPAPVSVTQTYSFVNSMAVDGAGNLFFITGGASLVTTSAGSPPIVSTTGTYTTSLQELSPDGVVLTPNTSTRVGLPLAGVNVGENMAIDAYGNLWIIDGAQGVLQKLPGLAVPKNYQ